MHSLERLLEEMNNREASDLYVTVDSPPCYRVEGIVSPLDNTRLSSEVTEKLAKQIMTPKQTEQFEITNEQNLAFVRSDLGRFRASIFRQKGAIGIVIRKIKAEIPTIEELNLPNTLKNISLIKRGLVLVVGATGCGKSTTLAAMTGYRNNHEAGHIISIENPIEFIHTHNKSLITQREVGIDTEDCHVALKNALRQAPDVILISEIRDAESMDAAITFAETGHLCLATLHSNNANQAIERIINFFPAERHNQIYLLLSLNLRSIISQRLIPSSNGDKRIPAVEILMDSPRVKDLIKKGQTDQLKEAMEKGTSVGMQTFDYHLHALYKSGKISLEEALINADSQNNLRLLIKMEGDTRPNGAIRSLALGY